VPALSASGVPGGYGLPWKSLLGCLPEKRALKDHFMIFQNNLMALGEAT